MTVNNEMSRKKILKPKFWFHLIFLNSSGRSQLKEESIKKILERKMTLNNGISRKQNPRNQSFASIFFHLKFLSPSERTQVIIFFSWVKTAL